MSDREPNRLIQEKSPYLLQHAHDAVNWYPWSEEAFEKARAENRPIFLSIGYSACHWCHKMREETFQDNEIALSLNEHFIPIKVDREELPHVDRIYMDFATVLSSEGTGWPLNLMITPELKPIYAVTYIPPRSAQGMMGMSELITHIRRIWDSDERAVLYEQAEKVVELFEKITLEEGTQLPNEDDLEGIVQNIFSGVDALNGGLEGSPKFPMHYQLRMLMDYAKLNEDARAAFFVSLTLDKMAAGGIYDCVGGGFHRYAVDGKWSIPHFEKMLYDNALLAEAYIDGYRFFKKEDYRSVANETLDFLLTEMRSDEGGFFSSIDSDSGGEEGRYYTWTIEEIEQILSKKEASFVVHCYQMSHTGNFEGRNVLHRISSTSDLAEVTSMTEDQVRHSLREIHNKLKVERDKRQAPFKDDKVLTSWNGLILQTLVKGAKILGRDDCAKAAVKLAGFIRDKLFVDGQLLRRYREGEAKFPGILDDYVFTIRAFLTLYEYDFGAEYLDFARELSQIVDDTFKSEGGAYYYTENREAIFYRSMECYDGAEPSGNSVHLENNLRLYALTQEDNYRDAAEDILRSVRDKLQFYAPGNAYLGISIQRHLNRKAKTMVVALNKDESYKEEILDLLKAEYRPHLSIIWLKEKENIPWTLDEKEAIDGKTTVYLCTNFACKEPITLIDELTVALSKNG